MQNSVPSLLEDSKTQKSPRKLTLHQKQTVSEDFEGHYNARKGFNKCGRLNYKPSLYFTESLEFKFKVGQSFKVKKSNLCYNMH